MKETVPQESQEGGLSSSLVYKEAKKTRVTYQVVSPAFTAIRAGERTIRLLKKDLRKNGKVALVKLTRTRVAVSVETIRFLLKILKPPLLAAFFWYRIPSEKQAGICSGR